MKRRKKKPIMEEGGPARWEMAFSSLSIILVSFFCLLNSYSDMERGRMIEVARSFKGAVALLTGGLNPELGTELILYSPDQMTRGRMAVREEMRRSIENLRAQIKDTGFEEQVSIVGSEEGVNFRLKNGLLFDSGSAALKPSAYPVIDIIANTIRKSEVLAVIEGHTDDRPIQTVVYPSNWELSAMRAVTVMRYMESRFKIPSHRIEARGHGEVRPIADNGTEEGRAENRRVDINLTAVPKGRHAQE